MFTGGFRWIPSTFFLKILYEDLDKKNRDTHVNSLFCNQFSGMYDWFLIGSPVLRKWGVGIQLTPPPIPPAKNVVKMVIIIFLVEHLISFNVTTSWLHKTCILCLVIVSCSPCPCNSQVHSQNEVIALKHLESLTFTKSFH